MAKALYADDRVRFISPTSTTKIASRMLAAADVVAHSLPAHFNSPEPLRILLTLLVAEDEGHSTATTDLSVKGRTQALTSRWIAALVKEGLVELSADQLGLTSLGYHKVTGMIEDVYSAQRLLD